MRKRNLVFIPLVLFLLSSLCITCDLLAFGIEPARIELTVGAGRQKGAMVTIDNSKSSEAVHIKVYLQDIKAMDNGDYDFPAANSTPWSCASWVKMVPQEIDVPAKQKENVRISVAVPEEAKGGYYAMVFFESGPSYTAEGLGINFRVGALLGVAVANTQVLKAEIDNIAFNEPKQIEVDVTNKGNVLIRPKGKIKILDAQGKKKIKQIDFNTMFQSILPDTTRKFYLNLDPALNSGSYKIKAEIDYGTRYLLVGELPIEIK